MLRLMLVLLVLSLCFPLTAMSADDIAGDLKVISTEDLGAGKMKVTLESYHKQGAFSGGKVYHDRWSVPMELLGQNFLPLQREFIALEGKGEILWEEMQREGYSVRVLLNKNLITSGEYRYKLAIILASDGSQPATSAVPELLTPQQGVLEYQFGDYLFVRWKGAGPNYRLQIFDEQGGQQVYAIANRTPKDQVPMGVFHRNGRFRIQISQADDGLLFGEPVVKFCRQYTRNQLDWERCTTCNGSGHIYVPDPPPTPHKADDKGQQVCPTCHGSGRVSVWKEHNYLDFNF